MSETDAEGVMDEHYGMITRVQAQRVAEQGGAGLRPPGSGVEKASVVSVNAFAAAHRADAPSGERPYVVNVQDRLYRVFNMQDNGQGRQLSRTVVLGSEGDTIQLFLSGELAREIDAKQFERGDVVFVRGALLDLQNCSLKALGRTTVARVMRSHTSISDFSLLREGQRGIDVSGKVTEIGQMRYVNRLSGSGQIAVSDCTITDGTSAVPVSMWGSSATSTSSMEINSIVKIEFCSVRERNSSLEIYANDLSRVLLIR